MKRIIFFGVLTVLFSCQNKEVLLPQAAETVVADVKDHSSVYFFFKIEEQDTLINVNRNNSISSTNCLFNIDKRLPLRKVILEIKKLQAKKEGSRYKSKDSESYFTYTDTVKKSMAFLPFAKMKYKLEKPGFNEVSFYFDRNDLVNFNDQIFSKNQLPAFIDKLPRHTRIIFSFDKGMSFGKYIQNEIFIKNLIAPQRITINHNKEYIY